MSERIQNVHPKEYGGIKYRSTLEAETAKALDAIGVPFQYEQRQYELLAGFRCPYQKERVRAITYTPDFILGGFLILECKGFETPEWRLKRKYVYRYLMEREPRMAFYQVKDAKKSLFEVLDHYWTELGYAIEATSIRKTKVPVGDRKLYMPTVMKRYASIHEAFADLGLGGKSIGVVARALMSDAKPAYGYIWKLKKITL